MTKGFFISFEGLDGCGKTTQSKLLSESLALSNIEHVLTREPGGTKQAEKIRELIVRGEPEDLDKMTELLLVMAARNEHILKLIKPSLKDGKMVICDRFIDSTIAYQGYGHNINTNLINNIYNIIAKNFYPDLTIILNIDLDSSLMRSKSFTTSEDRFEKMDKSFYERLRLGFLEIAYNNPDRCVIIDVSNNIEEMHSIIIEVINKKFGLKLNEVKYV